MSHRRGDDTEVRSSICEGRQHGTAGPRVGLVYSRLVLSTLDGVNESSVRVQSCQDEVDAFAYERNLLRRGRTPAEHLPEIVTSPAPCLINHLSGYLVLPVAQNVRVER